jgi:peptide/nickel transport system ATP-binding protein
LLDAFPSIRGPRVPLTGIPGSPPDLSRLPEGCSFQPRCPVSLPECKVTRPALYPAGPARSRCLLNAPSVRAGAGDVAEEKP